ncbi:MAG: carboxypeptidase-like regulatory domain-containing protein [Bacteroidetes bacterium]|nr:carboxypeptidase-like regulatory domain-containing protein [Bacteroidota bacterium]MBP6402869.1 carboxypeptidase-like regulatory domain-containing protein [Bacteroidia bacterium]MBP6650609.1 carboxypeptidase-like regulatory domain-containing protein [Bacteroidia bacterium]
MIRPLLCLLGLLISCSSFAQNAEIRGFIYEAESSEPSIYTSVYLKGTTYGAQTNLDGFYSISKVPPGSYTLMVTSVGYDSITIPIVLKAGDKISKKIFLKKSSVQMKEVNVSAESEEKKTDVRISVNKITPKEIRQIPTVGGEPDLAQYLQVLPGVIFSGDQGGQLYIRGGTPIQNKVLMDGMVIYNPFHSIGLYSVFDADIIRGADIYTGGFNAEYGDRISSIMDITTRDGNKKRIAGKVSANTFTAKALVEGPIKKEKEGEGGGISFLMTAKTSYLDQTSKSLYSNLDSAGLPYSFTDLYGKISFNSSSGSKLNLFGFNYSDDVDYNAATNLHWTSSGFGTNFLVVPTGSAAIIDGNFAYSGYKINLKEPDGRDRFSEINGFNTGLNFSYFLGKDEFRYGLEMLGFKTNYQFTNSFGSSTDQTENTTELAAYMKLKKIIGKLVIEPGVRLNYYSSLSETSIEPRLGMKFNLSNTIRLKAAGGFYSQNLMSASSDRDVVNLFYGFLSGSDDLPKTFNGKDVDSKLQKARHIIAGIEFDLPFHLTLNVEGYFKDFNQLENINRDKIYENDGQHSEKPDYLKQDYIIENGTARGIDFLLKYDYKKLYVWAVYSLGYVKRFDGIRTYEPSFDRRHNINLVTSYRFGKKDVWQANVRWNFGSAFPFTQTQGFYEQLSFPDGTGTNTSNQNGQLGIFYGELNKGRLSTFHRLDVSLQRSFHLSKNSNLEITAGATNVYDRENIFYVNRVTNSRVYQLPFLWNFGMNLTF